MHPKRNINKGSIIHPIWTKKNNNTWGDRFILVPVMSGNSMNWFSLPHRQFFFKDKICDCYVHIELDKLCIIPYGFWRWRRWGRRQRAVSKQYELQKVVHNIPMQYLSLQTVLSGIHPVRCYPYRKLTT